MPTLIEFSEELAKEWSDKNEAHTPSDISYGSNYLAWWKGSCGHEWQAKVKARTNGENCPYCAGKRIGVGINDLATLFPELAEEWSPKNEMKPTEITAGSSKKVLWKGKCGHEWEAIIKNRVNGSGCPYCNSISIKKGFNDFESQYPELAAEWSDKNKRLKPQSVMPQSNRKVWWKDKFGHEWLAPVSARVRGSGCPYCVTNKFLKGFNDLASQYPQIALDWSDKNVKRPDEISCKSRESFLWKCHACGYEWVSVVNTRVKNSACPECELKKKQAIRNEEMRRARAYKAYMKYLPEDMIKKYAEANGYTLELRFETEKKIKLQYYIPELNVAIEVADKTYNSKVSVKRENNRSRACKRMGIKLIRILRPIDREFDDISIRRKDDTDVSFAKAIGKAIEKAGIAKVSKPEKELKEMFEKFWEENK